MKSTFKRSDKFGPNFAVTTTFEVAEDYLKASYRNAYNAIKEEELVIKGFRPGKAPKELLEMERSDRAWKLAKSWIARDLRELIEEDATLLLLSDPVQKGDDFVFNYRGWRYPKLEVDALELDPKDIRGSAISLLSSEHIPAGIEKELMKGEVGAVVTDDKHLRDAIAINILTNSLEVDVADDELDAELGVLAVREGKSFAEIEPARDLVREGLIQRKVFEKLETLIGKS